MPDYNDKASRSSHSYKASHARSQHSSAAQEPASGGASSMRKKQKQLDILLCVLSGVLMLSILAAVFLPGALRQSAPVIDEPGDTSEAVSGLADDEEYDKDANVIEVNEYPDTILPSSADAGADYIKDTLFIGDSNTYRLMNYYDVTGVTLANCIGVEGMGVQSVPSLPCVGFKDRSNLVSIPEAVKIMQPRRIVMTFGTNNLGASTEGFIQNYTSAVKAIQEAYPYASIIIAAVPPVSQYHTYGTSVSMTCVDRYNLALVDLAEELGLKFLNWTETLKDASSGYMKTDYTLGDGIHINKNSAQAMINYARSHSYIVEDTRPKPLSSIPERSEATPGLITNDPSAYSGSRSRSSSSSGTAQVVFATRNAETDKPGGGRITIGNETQASVALSIVPGQTISKATAVPDEGYVFVRWECSVGRIPSVTNPVLTDFLVFATVSVGDTVYVTAVFEPKPVAKVDVVVSAGAGGLATGGVTGAVPGQTVTLTATPNSGYTFIGWGGSLSGTTSPATFTVPQDAPDGATYTITASFEKTKPAVVLVNVAVSAGEGGTVSGGVNGASPGQTITLTATPNAGYQFAGWSGAMSGAANPASFVVPADAQNGASYTITASFTPLPVNSEPPAESQPEGETQEA